MEIEGNSRWVESVNGVTSKRSGPVTVLDVEEMLESNSRAGTVCFHSRRPPTIYGSSYPTLGWKVGFCDLTTRVYFGRCVRLIKTRKNGGEKGLINKDLLRKIG